MEEEKNRKMAVEICLDQWPQLHGTLASGCFMCGKKEGSWWAITVSAYLEKGAEELREMFAGRILIIGRKRTDTPWVETKIAVCYEHFINLEHLCCLIMNKSSESPFKPFDHITPEMIEKAKRREL